MLQTRRLAILLLSISLLLSYSASSQTQNTDPQKTSSPNQLVAIRAARMLDVDKGTLITDPVIVIQSDKIVSVASRGPLPDGAKVIDLGDVTLIPG